MACQKVCIQGRDDAWMQRVNVLAKPHPYIFFIQQLDSAWKLLGSYLIRPVVSSFQVGQVRKWVWQLLTLHWSGSGSGWLGFIGTTVSSTFIAMMIDWSLLAFEPRLQPCVWTFTIKFACCSCSTFFSCSGSAHCIDAHAMRADSTPTNINRSHITTPTNLRKLVRLHYSS